MVTTYLLMTLAACKRCSESKWADGSSIKYTSAGWIEVVYNQTIVCHVTRILCSDWLVCHVTRILHSDWLLRVRWLEYSDWLTLPRQRQIETLWISPPDRFCTCWSNNFSISSGLMTSVTNWKRHVSTSHIFSKITCEFYRHSKQFFF